MIQFDYRKIRKEFKKLGLPEGLFNPCECPLESNKYFIICTERASGKTTNVLLLGLLLYKMYGCVTQYIRQYDEMLAPKNMRNLFDVIIQNGYIEKLTEGKYNTILYKARRWYYARVENEEVKEQSTEACVVCLSIQSDDVYRSTYNAPLGDFIVFDEFCSRRHIQDEFILYSDLLSTIIRTRSNPIIFMLGNTLDRYEYYFDELEIAEHMRYIQIGDSMSINTAKGTPIYIEIFAPNKKEKKSLVNKLFFGFKNSKLNSITGDDWLIVPYQHVDGSDLREILDNRHYVVYEGETLQIDVCHSEKYGVHCVIHRSTNLDKEDAIIYTTDKLNDIRYHFRFGYSKVDKMIWTLYDRNKFFYATNACASIMNKYIDRAEKITP